MDFHTSFYKLLDYTSLTFPESVFCEQLINNKLLLLEQSACFPAFGSMLCGMLRKTPNVKC
ncbi:hypothetical protein PSSHI_09080 [Photobacterium sp. R1]